MLFFLLNDTWYSVDNQEKLIVFAGKKSSVLV